MPLLSALGRLDSLATRGMKLGLSAIDAVCERLDRPERRLASVLVAGTNGKGSTAATLSALAVAGGVRTGLYTSPHLIDVTERIRVGERDVTPSRLGAALESVFAAADTEPAVPLTYFEALTAAAFLVFAEDDVALAVLEVGLGGRYDATNVAPALLSIVTSIGLDHTEELGPTLEAIAREKAGIFRRGRPALGRASSPDAREALAGAARAVGAIWRDAERELDVTVRSVSLDGTVFTLATPRGRAMLRTPLAGAHQAWNAALAIRAAELLSETEPRLAELPLTDGLGRVRWPGRCESLPYGGRTVVLDGCHNPEGAAALARFLADAGLFGRCPLLFGAMADKDVEGIGEALFPSVSRVFFVPSPSPRAAAPHELARRTRSIRPDGSCAESLPDALRSAAAVADGAPIIVAGSLYLVGEARARLLAGRTGGA
jgi:dihydrofolate synthase/folylpolyglutamate synthase